MKKAIVLFCFIFLYTNFISARVFSNLLYNNIDTIEESILNFLNSHQNRFEGDTLVVFDSFKNITFAFLLIQENIVIYSKKDNKWFIQHDLAYISYRNVKKPLLRYEDANGDGVKDFWILTDEEKNKKYYFLLCVVKEKEDLDLNIIEDFEYLVNPIYDATSNTIRSACIFYIENYILKPKEKCPFFKSVFKS